MESNDSIWKPASITPCVTKGHEREFIVAVKRAHSGKIYSFSASYLNAYPLNYEHECPKGEGCEGNGCDDGCPTTGWFRLTGDDGDAGQYVSLDLQPGDEFKGWRNVPQYPEHS